MLRCHFRNVARITQNICRKQNKCYTFDIHLVSALTQHTHYEKTSQQIDYLFAKNFSAKIITIFMVHIHTHWMEILDVVPSVTF